MGRKSKQPSSYLPASYLPASSSSPGPLLSLPGNSIAHQCGIWPSWRLGSHPPSVWSLLLTLQVSWTLVRACFYMNSFHVWKWDLFSLLALLIAYKSHKIMQGADLPQSEPPGNASWAHAQCVRAQHPLAHLICYLDILLENKGNFTTNKFIWRIKFHGSVYYITFHPFLDCVF